MRTYDEPDRLKALDRHKAEQKVKRRRLKFERLRQRSLFTLILLLFVILPIAIYLLEMIGLGLIGGILWLVCFLIFVGFGVLHCVFWLIKG